MKPEALKGLVIRTTGSFATVLLSNGEKHECRVKGQMRIKGLRTTNPVAVGDHVVVENAADPVITAIEPRKNYLIRKSINLSRESQVIAANLDLVVIICTLHSPRTSFGFIDRLLATCEAYQMGALIVLNKIDLLDDPKYHEARISFHEIYQVAGYEVLETSAAQEWGLEDLRKKLEGKTSLLTGHSGSGKSSLLNVLDPALNRRTGEISEVHAKGKHTTTFAEMFHLNGGIQVIDTPGVKEFGLIDMQANEIDSYFPEIFKVSSSCRFNNCLHLQEPGCAVPEALERGLIPYSRYHSYLSILDSEELKNKHS